MQGDQHSICFGFLSRLQEFTNNNNSLLLVSSCSLMFLQDSVRPQNIFMLNETQPRILNFFNLDIKTNCLTRSLILTSRPRLVAAGSKPKNKQSPIDITREDTTVKSALRATPTCKNIYSTTGHNSRSAYIRTLK